jgi:hypothetical protein
MLGVCTIFLSVIFTGLTQLVLSRYIVIIGFTITSILNAMHNLFNFASLSEEHGQFATKFQELHLTMQSELCKPNKIACDILIQYKLQFIGMKRSAPHV